MTDSNTEHRTKSTNSTINTGYVAAKLYTQGALYANGEFIRDTIPRPSPGPTRIA